MASEIHLKYVPDACATYGTKAPCCHDVLGTALAGTLQVAHNFIDISQYDALYSLTHTLLMAPARSMQMLPAVLCGNADQDSALLARCLRVHGEGSLRITSSGVASNCRQLVLQAGETACRRLMSNAL